MYFTLQVGWRWIFPRDKQLYAGLVIRIDSFVIAGERPGYPPNVDIVLVAEGVVFPADDQVKWLIDD